MELLSPLQELLAQSGYRERQMKPQTLGPALALSVLCFWFAEIKTGSYVAQVSLCINYVAEGDPHLYLDLLRAGLTRVSCHAGVRGAGDGTSR